VGDISATGLFRKKLGIGRSRGEERKKRRQGHITNT